MKESLQPLPLHDHTDMRRFELEVDGHIAFTEYERTGKRIFLVHTEVPKELEGKVWALPWWKRSFSLSKPMDGNSSLTAPM